MPFVVDDILVHFDDERTESTLQVFNTLAAKTQVILFTHHARVAEQARRASLSLCGVGELVAVFPELAPHQITDEFLRIDSVGF